MSQQLFPQHQTIGLHMKGNVLIAPQTSAFSCPGGKYARRSLLEMVPEN